MRVDVVVVGGGPGGYTSALVTKRLYPEMSVLLIRRDEKAIVPCGSPYIFATLGTVDKNLLPDDPLKKAGVEILIDEVTDIDRSGKRVKLKGGREIEYGKLILATGSVPKGLKVPGAELDGVFYVYKSYDYLRKLRGAIEEASKIVIIGGGFVGVEFADDIAAMGKEVTIVELLPHCLLLNFDEEFAVLAEEELKKRGVNIVTGVRVKELRGDKRVKAVVLEDGREIPCDLVIISVGTRPNVELAQKCGLKIHELGAIDVDEYLRTSDPNIFAVGDCSIKRDFLTGKPMIAMLASIAAMEGRVVASNILGLTKARRMPGVVFVCSTQVGELCLGAAGYTERRAKEEGLDYLAVTYTTVNRHPGAIPDARKITMKLLFLKRSGQLIGAEVAGGKEVGELINLLALAIQDKATVANLLDLQFGTHPKLTPSPIAYHVVNAAEEAIRKLRT
ncbi:MAG: pyridine nucleotide-disulfide oxidoreductase [Thermoprotei archaeon]|nr:MAG: pyridine nucleotide-disulfide oxidoreductase [Thermoprotei archaeon]